MHRTTRRALRTTALLAAATTVLGLALTSTATAKGGEPGDDKPGGATAGGVAGDYAVTVNGTTYNPAAGKDAKLRDVTVRGTVKVTGVHTSFTIDPATLGVYDYTLTGAPAPAPDRMVTSPTVVFASKVPSLSAAQLARPVLTDLQVRDDTLVATFGTAAGELKVQAKDQPQGGIFQMEPEFGTAVELVHTLGPGLFYFTNPFTGKINVGDGADAVASGPDAHQMLLGKDSPQVATKLFQDGRTTRWSVTSGGRLGGVLGEDAIELSQGATNCTSQCQAQNQVRGSLPVPPDPTNPTPLPVTTAAATPARSGSAAAARSGDDDRRVERAGSCTGGARWKIKAKEDDGRIEVEAEIDSNRSGQRWTWTLGHDGSRAARGASRTTGRSGSFSVERKVVDRPGTDAFVFRASHAGQRCVARVGF
jgi:hypothetical protein